MHFQIQRVWTVIFFFLIKSDSLLEDLEQPAKLQGKKTREAILDMCRRCSVESLNSGSSNN